MNIEPAAILALIAELYATSQAQQQRITELEARLALGEHPDADSHDHDQKG